MGMFSNCSSLNSIDLKKFFTQNVTHMTGMFHGCRNLVKLDLSHFDTSNVYYMNGMFYNCYSLVDLDLSSFNCVKIKSSKEMEKMFYGCKYLKKEGIKFKDDKINKQIILDLII